MAQPKVRTTLDMDPELAQLLRDLSAETGTPQGELTRRGLVLIFRQRATEASPELAERLRSYELPRRGGGQG